MVDPVIRRIDVSYWGTGVGQKSSINSCHRCLDARRGPRKYGGTACNNTGKIYQRPGHVQQETIYQTTRHVKMMSQFMFFRKITEFPF